MILLAHIILFNPPEGQKTFSLQHILSVPVPSDIQGRFGAACSTIFDAFNGSTNSEESALGAWELCATKMSLALVQLVQMFVEKELVCAFFASYNSFSLLTT